MVERGQRDRTTPISRCLPPLRAGWTTLLSPSPPPGAPICGESVLPLCRRRGLLGRAGGGAGGGGGGRGGAGAAPGARGPGGGPPGGAPPGAGGGAGARRSARRGRGWVAGGPEQRAGHAQLLLGRRRQRPE